MNKKSIFFCVGSGGHVLPIKNIILDLIKNGVSKEEIIIFTDKRGAEYLKGLETSMIIYNFSYSQQGLLGYVFKVLHLIKAIIFVYKKTKIHNINYFFTSGAYIAPIATIVSIILRVDIYNQEQNIYAGYGNKFTSYFSKFTFTAFPDTKNLSNRNVKFAGPILNRDLEKVSKVSKSSTYTIGIQGGSQGSKELIEYTEKLSKDLKDLQIKFICITGKTLHTTKDSINISYKTFYQKMSKFYSEIDLQISRAGGGSLEAAYLQIPQILVPYKHGTTKSHQSLNAKYLKDLGVAQIANSYEEIYAYVNNFYLVRNRKNNRFVNIKNGLDVITKELMRNYD